MDDKIKKLYMNGFTYIEIAKQLNTSEIKIKHIIDIRLNNYKELHLRNKLKRDNLYKSCNFDIKDLYVVGYNAREIANKLGHKYENVQKMADAALAWKGHIDILVNNAGGGSGKTEGDFLKRDPADIQNLIDINLTGSVFCSKAVGAMMAKAGCGKIINIASISAFLARDRRTYHLHNKMEQPVDYAAAKGGVVGYTIDLAAVMSQYGVYVNCISPGAFDKGDQPEGYSQAYRDKVPLGRMGRFGIDIKGAALLLASPASDYMTGANIVVDGGFSIWN